MRVGRLIQMLARFDPELRVVIPGYEGGVDDVRARDVRRVLLCVDVNPEDYYGAHEIVTTKELSAPPDLPNKWAGIPTRAVDWRTASRKEKAVVLGKRRWRR